MIFISHSIMDGTQQWFSTDTEAKIQSKLTSELSVAHENMVNGSI